MQNFTLGKKGISMLFFTFFLLIGSSPTFGQECTVAGNFPPSQEFCYLETINDLDTDGLSVFQTSDTTNDTQSIPGDELLTDGAIYWVNSPLGDCRSPLTVVVNNAPRPANIITNSVVSGFEFTTCTPATFNSDDLADLFEAQTDYSIEVYATEESTIPLDGVTLNNGDSYFVGQVPDATENASTDTCPSFRVAVGFNPNQIEGPTAEAEQTFCEDATVADLVAEGTYDDTQAIRWYRSQTANTPLSDDTQLISGQSYFAAQVVNERGSITPPCETPAIDRAEVTVTLVTFDAGPDSLGSEICKADLDARIAGPETGDAILLSFIDEINFDYESVSFNPTAQSIYNSYLGTPYQKFTTTATFTTAEGCEDDVVIDFTVLESYNAGQDGSVTLSLSDSPVNLFDYLGGTPDTGGTWSPGNTDGSFDPSTDPAGVYTYSVGSGDCQDTATITVTIEECNIAGADHSIEVCNTDIAQMFPGVSSVRAFYLNLLDDGVPTDGTFSPTINELVNRYNSGDQIGDFVTTYTVGSGDCIDSTVLTLTILPVVPANAGTIEDVTVDCNNEELIVLASLPNESGNTGGTFTGEGVTNGTFDPSVGPGTYTITYTVDDTAVCVTPGTSDETTFTITVQSTFDLGAPIVMEMCITEVEAMLVNPQLAIDLFNDAVAERTNGDLTGEFTPSTETIAGQIAAFLSDPIPTKTFETTYSVSTECGDDSVLISLTINDVTEATTGDIADFQVCAADSTINLFDRLTDDNTPGGTFSTEDGEIVDGLFNISEIGEYNITYTVSEDQADACVEGTASTEFTLTIEQSGDAGQDGSVTLSLSDSPVNLFDYLGGTPDTGGTWSPGNTDGSFDPSTDPAGVYTYSVGSGDCQDTATITVTIEECNIAGADHSIEVCNTDIAQMFPGVSSVRAFYLNLLDDGVPTDGTFSPTINELVNRYNSGDQIGDFVTTYTVGSGDCIDSTVLTLTILPVVPANAGTIEDVTVDCNNEELIVLASLPNESGNTGGTFTGEGVTNGTFDPSVGPGTYTITYTVDDTAVCVTPGTSDETTFTITVQSTFDLGAPIVMEMCITEVEAMLVNPQLAIDLFNDAVAERTNGDLTGEFTPSTETIAGQIAAFLSDPIPTKTFETTYSVSTECGDDSVLISLTINDVTEATTGDIADFQVCAADSTINLFDRLTDDNTPGGTFSTEDGEIVDGLFNISEIGEYNITYTVSEDQADACVEGTASTEFTITVVEGEDAGQDGSIEVCNADVRNLSTTAVRNLYLSLLDDGVPTNGTFNPTISELINQYNIVSNYGDFTTTYTLGEGDCADSAVLTVTVIEANDAGADMNLTFCSTEGPVNLFNFLSPYATTNGTFEGLTDGIFDPSSATIGENVIIYEVEDDESVCSTGNFTATFTITVLEPEVANAGGNQTPPAYCVTDDQDIALVSLLEEGANPFGSFEIDGDVITSVNPAELGVGEFVITYSIDENDCAIGTDSSTITITVVATPDAPVADANQSFCLIDNPTVADITVTGENVIIYEDEALTQEASATDPLANDAVYYAVSTTGDNGCNSEAVMINISLSDGTAPTLQTEGNEFCRSDNPTIQDLIANLNGSGIQIYPTSTGGTALATSTALVNGTTYFASGTDAGCESSERTAIQVEVAFCGIPEAFSPNGDNINDRFVIPDIAIDFPNYTIEIFNRWGNVVFKGNSSTGDWDGVSNQSGTLGDNVLAAGVYFYILNYNDGQTAPIQGKVYLSR
ncbi:MAG: gliding motility-associated C-terminal domain-containing protein [Bacteroidota bacterium]